jgi:hypothetical protein
VEIQREADVAGERAVADEATVQAVQKAVGHLEDLFKRVQEAGNSEENSRVERVPHESSQVNAAAKEMNALADSLPANSEELAALLLRAERLAAIHVPRELLRLQKVAAGGRRSSACADRYASPDRVRQSLGDRHGDAVSEVVQRSPGQSLVHSPVGMQPQHSAAVEALAVLRTSSTVYVLEEQLTSIGRDDACDLRLCGRGVSRFHAEIIFDMNQNAILRDLGSSNGTFVNFQRLRPRQSCSLQHGDVLHFSAYDKTSFTFELPGHKKLDAPSSPPPATLLAGTPVIKCPVDWGQAGAEVADPAGHASSALNDTQIPWKPKRFPSDVGFNSGKPPGADSSQQGSETPVFGPASGEDIMPPESSAAVPAVRRAVDRLEDVLSRLENFNSSDPSDPVQQEVSSIMAPEEPSHLAGDVEHLQGLVQRAERLAASRLPSGADQDSREMPKKGAKQERQEQFPSHPEGKDEITAAKPKADESRMDDPTAPEAVVPQRSEPMVQQRSQPMIQQRMDGPTAPGIPRAQSAHGPTAPEAVAQSEADDQTIDYGASVNANMRRTSPAKPQIDEKAREESASIDENASRIPPAQPKQADKTMDKGASMDTKVRRMSSSGSSSSLKENAAASMPADPQAVSPEMREPKPLWKPEDSQARDSVTSKADSLAKRESSCEPTIEAPQLAHEPRKERKPKVKEGKSESQSSLDASHLRQQLAPYDGLVPLNQAEASFDTQGEESMVSAELRHWQDIVSSKDTLDHNESGAVLHALLRTERAIAETRRCEVASNRRWTALTEEGRLLKEKSRTLQSGVRKLRERSAGVSVASCEHQQKLWKELESQTAACGDEEQHLAASCVREELDSLAKTVCELHNQIAALEDEEAECMGKQLRAQHQCALLERLGCESEELADRETALNVASVDEIVKLEVENERLQWLLYHTERQSRNERRGFGELDAISDHYESESLDAGSVFSMDADGVNVTRRQRSQVRPEVAELRRRLSLSRDERRELERGTSNGRSSSRSRGRPPLAAETPSARDSSAQRRDMQSRSNSRSKADSFEPSSLGLSPSSEVPTQLGMSRSGQTRPMPDSQPPLHAVAPLGEHGPSELWGDVSAAQEDTLGLSASLPDLVRAQASNLRAQSHGTANRSSIPGNKFTGDSLDMLCERPVPVAFEPLGQIPVDMSGQGARSRSTGSRTASAMAAGALAVSGPSRSSPAATAYPPMGRSPSDAWNAAPGESPSLPSAFRPPLARAPHKLATNGLSHNTGRSPSDAWLNQGSGTEVPGDAVVESSAFINSCPMPGTPLPPSRPVPRPLSGRRDGIGVERSSFPFAGDLTSDHTFITQAPVGSTPLPSGPGPPGSISRASNFQGASSSVNLSKTASAVRSVRLELDED